MCGGNKNTQIVTSYRWRREAVKLFCVQGRVQNLTLVASSRTAGDGGRIFWSYDFGQNILLETSVNSMLNFAEVEVYAKQQTV